MQKSTLLRSLQKIRQGAFVLAGLASVSSQMSLALPASVHAKHAQSNEIYYTTMSEPPTMDPSKDVNSVSGFWLGHLFEGLVTYDSHGNTIPGAAKKMNVSADGKTYTFELRSEARWHDGKPVTASDFVYAVHRLAHPKTASTYLHILRTANLENAEDVISGKLAPEKLGVRAINASTLELRLSRPTPYLSSLLMLNVFFPLRQDVIEKHGDKAFLSAESIVGNGPFKLTKWQKGSSLRMEKAETYWNAKSIQISAIEEPFLITDQNAVYNAFVTGGIDVLPSIDAEGLKKAAKDKLKTKTSATGVVFYLELNQRKGKPLSHPSLRKALNLALNRNEFVAKIVGVPGYRPLQGLVPDVTPGSSPKLSFRKEAAALGSQAGSRLGQTFDLKEAREAFNHYLKETGKSETLSLSLLTGDHSGAKRQAEYLQHSLRKALGIDIKIDSIPYKAMLQKLRDRDFDIAFSGWFPDYNDPMTYLELFALKSSYNNGEWSNAKYDERIAQAQSSESPTERVRLMAEAERLLINDFAIIPMVQGALVFATAPSLQGVSRPAFIPSPDFRYASWKKSKTP